MWTKNLYTRRSAVTKCGSTILAGSTAAQGRHSPHGLLSIGHCCFDADVPIHLSKQCIWNICVHSPHTKSAIKQRGTRAHMRVLKINTARAVAQRKKKRKKKDSTERTIVPRHLARRATSLKRHATYTTHVAFFLIFCIALVNVCRL